MLRSLSLLVLASVLPIGGAGCGDPNAGVAWANIQYATRCELGATRHCGGPMDVDICGFNQSDPCDMGAPQVSVSCSVNQTDTQRTLNFSASHGSGGTISVSNAVFALAGGAASGPSCRVTVRAGANTYVGTCGGGPPSPAQPCQLSGFTFMLVEGRPTVEGDLFCQNLEHQADRTRVIEVTAAGTGPTAQTSPANIEIQNCAGLRL